MRSSISFQGFGTGYPADTIEANTTLTPIAPNNAKVNAKVKANVLTCPVVKHYAVSPITAPEPHRTLANNVQDLKKAPKIRHRRIIP
jgi:hypothetical protein